MRTNIDVYLEDVVGNQIRYMSPAKLLYGFEVWIKSGCPTDEPYLGKFIEANKSNFGYY